MYPCIQIETEIMIDQDAGNAHKMSSIDSMRLLRLREYTTKREKYEQSVTCQFLKKNIGAVRPEEPRLRWNLGDAGNI